MKTLIVAIIVAIGLSGCATTQSGAILSGALIGASIGVIIADQPKEHYNEHRYYSCIRERMFIGYDRYGVPVFTTHHVCR